MGCLISDGKQRWGCSKDSGGVKKGGSHPNKAGICNPIEWSTLRDPSSEGFLYLTNHQQAPQLQMSNKSEIKALCESPFCKDNNTLQALRLYDEDLVNNVPLNAEHYNKLLYLCSSCNSDLGLERGFEIFSKMKSDFVLNEATIITMAMLAASKEDLQMAFDLVKKLKEECEISLKLRSYVPALAGFCKKGLVDVAYEVDGYMIENWVMAKEREFGLLLRVSVGRMSGTVTVTIKLMILTKKPEVQPIVDDVRTRSEVIHGLGQGVSYGLMLNHDTKSKRVGLMNVEGQSVLPTRPQAGIGSSDINASTRPQVGVGYLKEKKCSAGPLSSHDMGTEHVVSSSGELQGEWIVNKAGKGKFGHIVYRLSTGLKLSKRNFNILMNF
ncbi:proteinaceous RNase P 1 [Artemisia annua]|uniref:Proteinaceous RNase P 1 n=1 Tax=Artemisia annua TaxID=35608 RepID=A0A2U1LAF7_ARTAN|nr:proteinaceous RNase P 1 [Artemisia annua]